MAENKKGFLLYADQLEVVMALDDDRAGKLFKHLLQYVNDQNPSKPEDPLVNLAWIPIRQQLKRDLKKWDESLDQKSRAGIIGNLKRHHPDIYNLFKAGSLTFEEAVRDAKHRKPSQTSQSDKTPSQNLANVAVNVNDNVTVNDNDNVISNKESELIYPWDTKNFKVQWEIWKDYKQTQHRFKYKHIASEQAALTQLQKKSQNREARAIEIIHYTMANGWQGFVVPKEEAGAANGLDILKNMQP